MTEDEASREIARIAEAERRIRLVKPGRLALVIGRLRLWLGSCPRCNTDAPEMDFCAVCDGRGAGTGDWPPSP